MQATVAYYLIADRRRRMPSSSYLRAELTEAHDASHQYPQGVLLCLCVLFCFHPSCSHQAIRWPAPCAAAAWVRVRGACTDFYATMAFLSSLGLPSTHRQQLCAHIAHAHAALTVHAGCPPLACSWVTCGCAVCRDDVSTAFGRGDPRAAAQRPRACWHDAPAAPGGRA